MSPIIDENKDELIVEKIITVFDLIEDDDVYGPKLPPEPIIQNENQIKNYTVENINRLNCNGKFFILFLNK